MKHIQVEGHPGLARDPNTGAIINTDTAEIERAKKIKAKRQSEKAKLKQLEDDVNDIKIMLNTILEKL